jgi:predicted dehydrogenase
MADSLPRDVVIEKSDAVVIASPTSEHWEDILDCKKANKPCFVEKPISEQIKIVGSMGTDANGSHLKHPLMVGYNLRFHPCVIKAKEWISDDRIGEPYWGNFVCAQFNDRPQYLRDGVTLNWSHEIDLALHLLGKAEVGGALITKKDDIADILLRHSVNVAHSGIHLDYVTRPEHRGFSVVGPKGLIIGNIPARTIAIIGHDGTMKQTEQYPGSYDDDYVVEMAAFLAKVEGSIEPMPGCTAEEAIEVLKVCLKAKKVAGI